ncbi:MAG: Na+/H+ antiporter NhaA [Candidatus Marinimicrobia bacterium]|nr:Na+/H+ antiporter NhaA [Candidatus Neomarinimicrobiota bacterium]
MSSNNNSVIKKFLSLESSSGVLLMGSAILAMIIANSPWSNAYNLFIDTPVQIRIGALEIAKPLLLWINDGLMALFFLLVGLELKREVLQGELSSMRKVALPAFGEIGGMLVPSLIYIFFNYTDPVAIKGWAIPAATDIAFALGILALLGSRVPVSIKIFLTSLAIFDDIGAILIIAFFYTAKISLLSLLVAGLCTIGLYLLNRLGVEQRSPYLGIGVVMWVALLKSGVHATLAGVILAMFIPLQSRKKVNLSPLKELEHDLHALVAFGVLPIFAFANAGISLVGVGSEQLLHGVPVGITLGLFIGKQAGIIGLCWLAIKLRFADMLPGVSWLSLYGTSVLCGVGFTMSLFIGSLAFEETGVNLLFDERLGIIIGSLLSGLWGYGILKYSLSSNNFHQTS